MRRRYLRRGARTRGHADCHNEGVAEQFDRVAFNETLDETRRMRGLSWRAVALEAGLVPSTVYRISRGAIPDLSNFAALVDWLGVSADEFLRGRARPRIEASLRNGQRVHLDVPKNPSHILSTRELEMIRKTIAVVAENIEEAKADAVSAA